MLRHYGIHSRFLIALPVLVFGEKSARSMLERILPRFLSMGLVTRDKEPAFRQVIVEMIRLRDSTLPWVAIGGAILMAALVPSTGHNLAELAWARDQHGTLGFGGWWFLCVSRPLYQIFLFGWVWRGVLLFLLFRKIAKLRLELEPAHPDHLGGLAFVTQVPRLFAPMAFSMSVVMSSKWAHEIAWHGAHISHFKMEAAALGALLLLISHAPLLVFLSTLKKTKRRALAEYGTLIARHARLVRKVWIKGEPVEDRSLLEAPELGPTCDINSIYESVTSMRRTPFGKSSALPVLMAAALPMLIVSAMEIPVAELAGKVFKALL